MRLLFFPVAVVGGSNCSNYISKNYGRWIDEDLPRSIVQMALFHTESREFRAIHKPKCKKAQHFYVTYHTPIECPPVQRVN